MASNKKTVPFYGTEEQKEQLLKVIQELRDEKGCLMPIMQKAQEIYGYLPIEVQKIISDELNVPLEEDLWCCHILFMVQPESEGQV